jgi:hypothetical protein
MELLDTIANLYEIVALVKVSGKTKNIEEIW